MTFSPSFNVVMVVVDIKIMVAAVWHKSRDSTPTHYNLRQNIQVIAAPLFSFIVKHYTQMISLLIGQCERHLILSLLLIGQISLLLSHITQMITAALLTDKRASPALEIQRLQFAELSVSDNNYNFITEENSTR